MIQTLWHLIAQYGYIAIGIGCFFEGEASILLGMLAVNRGILSPELVWLAATIGTVVGDNIWFYFGHRMGKPALAKRPKWHAKATRIEALLENYGALIMIFFRYIYAMRSVTPFVLGALGVSPWRFLFYDVLGTVIWSTGVTLLAYYLAGAISSALTNLQNVEHILLISCVVTALGAWGVYYWRQRHRRQNEDND